MRSAVARARQLVLIAATGEGQGAPGGALSTDRSLGQKREVVRTLSRYNTAPDGSPEGFGVLHGPGIRVELPMVDDRDEVTQLLVTLLEDEIGWPVLARICRQERWRMMDPETGRVFSG